MLNTFHNTEAAADSAANAPAQPVSDPLPANPPVQPAPLPIQKAPDQSKKEEKTDLPQTAANPPAAETRQNPIISKKDPPSVQPASVAGEPIRRPVTPPTPVTIDGPAAWVAIPTSPQPGDAPAIPSQRSSSLKFVVIGFVALVILAGLFFVFRSSIATGPTNTPPVAALASATPATQVPVVAAATATATEPAASPTPLTPTPAPTDTIQPPTETAAASVVVTPTLAAGGGASRLLFVSNRDGDFRAFMVDPEQPTQWTQIPLPEEYELINWPTFCGERIAYEAEDRSLNLPRWVFIYDPATQEIQPVKFADKPADRAYLPRCSLDGRFMALSVLRNGRWHLNVVEIESGNVVFEQPANGYPQFGFATWAAANDYFLWLGIKSTGYYDINQTTGLTTNGSPKTTLMAQGKYPAISPDGTKLAYFCGNLSYLCMVEWPSQKTIFQIPISYFKPINGEPAPASVTWSRDGEWVFFSSSVAGNWDIYRMRPDGSQVQNLTEGSLADELKPAAR